MFKRSDVDVSHAVTARYLALRDIGLDDRQAADISASYGKELRAFRALAWGVAGFGFLCGAVAVAVGGRRV